MTYPIQPWWDVESVMLVGLKTLWTWLPQAYATGEAFADVDASARCPFPTAPAAFETYGIFQVPTDQPWFARQTQLKDVTASVPFVMVDATDTGETETFDDGSEIAAIDLSAWIAVAVDQSSDLQVTAETLRQRAMHGARVLEYYLLQKLALVARGIDATGQCGIIGMRRGTGPNAGPQAPMIEGSVDNVLTLGYTTIRVLIRRYVPVTG